MKISLFRAGIQTAEVIMLLYLYIKFGWAATLCGAALLITGGIDFSEYLFDNYEVSEK